MSRKADIKTDNPEARVNPSKSSIWVYTAATEW